ncbi:uncharacterized protein VTP21DRAFT_262 [Calcarisporiella thermophila]|uniref:uncharacterized protein n=1 Tax=Calcarisporiella thermophila TaxID=911321 RepID=UPI0037429221
MVMVNVNVNTAVKTNAKHCENGLDDPLMSPFGEDLLRQFDHMREKMRVALQQELTGPEAPKVELLPSSIPTENNIASETKRSCARKSGFISPKRDFVTQLRLNSDNAKDIPRLPSSKPINWENEERRSSNGLSIGKRLSNLWSPAIWRKESRGVSAEDLDRNEGREPIEWITPSPTMESSNSNIQSDHSQENTPPFLGINRLIRRHSIPNVKVGKKLAERGRERRNIKDKAIPRRTKSLAWRRIFANN